MTPVTTAFVFVHSYSSAAPNWEAVQLGLPGRAGRVHRALQLAAEFGVRVVANDAVDSRNARLYADHGIENIATALDTRDEVASAVTLAGGRRIVFVTSPDHLPRVARDALACGASDPLFAASAVPFSEVGAAGVAVQEPWHRKSAAADLPREREGPC